MSVNEYLDINNLRVFKEEEDKLLAKKQETLVSGENIRTLSGKSILGSGDVPLTEEDVGIGAIPELDVHRLFRTEYQITATVANGVATGPASVWTRETATLEIEPDDGYWLPASVAVTGADASYDVTTGVLVLSNPTGAVTVDATCPAMPLAKGDIISFDALGDGTQKRFRVVKPEAKNVVFLLSLEDFGKCQYNTTDRRIAFDDGVEYQNYEGSVLDVTLNETYYNTLSAATKAAIVPTNRVQSVYTASTNKTVIDQFATFNVLRMDAAKYDWHSRRTQRTVGVRNCYAIDIDELVEYFQVPPVGILDFRDVMEMYTEQRDKNIGWYAWTATASHSGRLPLVVHGDRGNFSVINSDDSNRVARPAFRINLATIDYTKE